MNPLDAILNLFFWGLAAGAALITSPIWICLIAVVVMVIAVLLGVVFSPLAGVVMLVESHLCTRQIRDLARLRASKCEECES